MNRLVVLGSVNADHVLRVPHFPRPGETLTGHSYQVVPGGKGANQAVAAARLGAEVSFIARIGDDAIGQQMKTGFANDGIDVSAVELDPKLPTGIAIIYVSDEGENSIGISAEANGALTPTVVKSHQAMIAAAHTLLLQLEVPLESVHEAARLARAHGTRVVLNPAPARPLSSELLALVDLITPNQTEAELLTGVKVTDEASAREAAARFHQMGIADVMITLGSQGVYCSKGQQQALIPGFRVKAVDTTAAGDTFNGALLAAELAGADFDAAVRFAHGAAALSVTRFGAQSSIPSKQEVDDFLLEQTAQGALMANIKEVAALAGVSTTTVSHVINETRFVAEETRERVFSAMRDLNYAPSLVARSLKVKETNSIGMLVTTSSNPFFAEVVRGVERYCFEQGYNLMLGNTEGQAETALSYLKMMLRKRVDGLLIMCSEGQQEVFNQLDWLKSLPVVVMDWGMESADVDLIADNSHRGGYLATRHLLGLGHTAIGCITGPHSRAPANQRQAGFEQAMQEAGLTVNPQWVQEGDFDCASGHQAMTRLLALPERPTALFVCNDMMAMGAISAAHQAGLVIPRDLSIVGYDNVALAEFMSPPLTTVNQPKEELGRLAVTRLLARINGEAVADHLITVDPDLVIRDSCAPAPEIHVH